MGCDIVRLAIPDEKAVEAFAEIKKKVRIPW
jgi:4-hydroxy-3-methylbut-2-en-1-yl diphosphate synthase IspG/GcpE